MTDNEKRAHDLAIAICIDCCHLKAKSQLANGEKDISIDYFREYLKAYKMAIGSFIKNFQTVNSLSANHAN